MKNIIFLQNISAIKQHDKLRIGDWLRTIDGQQVKEKLRKMFFFLSFITEEENNIVNAVIIVNMLLSILLILLLLTRGPLTILLSLLIYCY